MRKIAIFMTHTIALCSLLSCAAVPYYDDASIGRISKGDEVRIQLVDGEKASLVVAEINADEIIGDDGEVFAKRDIETVKIRVPADSIPCSSFASWRNMNCWSP